MLWLANLSKICMSSTEQAMDDPGADNNRRDVVVPRWTNKRKGWVSFARTTHLDPSDGRVGGDVAASLKIKNMSKGTAFFGWTNRVAGSGTHEGDASIWGSNKPMRDEQGGGAVASTVLTSSSAWGNALTPLARPSTTPELSFKAAAMGVVEVVALVAPCDGNNRGQRMLFALTTKHDVGDGALWKEELGSLMTKPQKGWCS